MFQETHLKRILKQKEKKNDLIALNDLLSHLNEKDIDFDKKNTSYYVQPKWEDGKHYFESVKDQIKFMVSSISQQV